jgi:glutamate carboxypeptidase
MGSALKSQDLSRMEVELPVSELEMLRAFSKIDSSTLNKAGVMEMQNRVGEFLSELKFEIQWVGKEERFGDLLIAEKKGRSNKFITLITHSDTVLRNYRDFSVDENERKGFGSGAIDNKGGLVVGLCGLQRFLLNHADLEYSLRFVCSPNEEMGSIGFTEIFRELGSDTVVAFGLEPALDNGSIIHQRRGNRWYDLTVIGREAHAGRSYGNHVNAAHDLAAKIVDLAALTKYKKHVSVSVGHIEGGKDRHNIICGEARAKLDVRFPSMDLRDDLHAKIEKILETPRETSIDGKFKSQTTYKIVDDCPPFSLTKKSRRMAREYSALISKLENRLIQSQPSGGAGDVNYLSTRNNFVLDGLGPVGGEMHTNREFVNVDTLKTRAQALAGFLIYLQGQKLD